MDEKLEAKSPQDLKFDQRGLVPAIVQDKDTKQVLMLAYMNAESLTISLREGRTCFYSRSRQKLWRKGETSGNIQKIDKIFYDCDKDTLLVLVEQHGPACHTGKKSCFYRQLKTKVKK
jgi:phosphoribosyl-ATP pyrophosphohydrolase/phosphoribosyl-AMP cyclohydrolase